MSNAQIFMLVNIVGGAAVLGSYLLGLISYPNSRVDLWGGIEGIWRTIFVISMLFAAVGYLFFCYTITISNGENTSSFLGNHTFSILATLFLLSASIWMPATLQYIETKFDLWWIVSVISLWITAASLLGLTLAFRFIELPSIGSVQTYLSLAGLFWISFHCLFFDAIIWVAKFH